VVAVSLAPPPILEPTEARDIPPWLLELGWLKHLEKIPGDAAEDLRLSTELPKANSLCSPLPAALLEYFRMAANAARTLNPLIRSKIQGKNE
jgi:hypothetical protein